MACTIPHFSSAERMREYFRKPINKRPNRRAQGHDMTIPELEHYCGSWIVVSRETGSQVLETFERRTAEAINQTAYEVLTAAQWLARLNQRGTT